MERSETGGIKNDKQRIIFKSERDAATILCTFFKIQSRSSTSGKTGEVFTGCNVENSSLGATICAERTAFVKAISEGSMEFEAIAIVCNEGEAWPCGICRQFMKEFCEDDFKIITGNDEDSLKVYTMAEILPEGFRLL